MSTQGQWDGQWAGSWQGATEDAPPGSISGVATFSVVAAGTLSGVVVETPGQNNGVSRPLGGFHVVSPPARPFDAVVGELAGVVVIRVTVRGELTATKPRKRARLMQALELLELA